MDLDKLRELIGILQASDLAEMEIEEDGRRIRLSKGAPQPAQTQHVITHVPHVAPTALDVPVPAAAQPATAPSSATQPAEPEHDDSLVIIESPMVGVFFAQPSPGDPPFVKPGDTVEENQTVCIVEAMKLMNEVTSKFRCTIVNVLVENAEPVEYNQPLFAVKLIE